MVPYRVFVLPGERLRRRRGTGVGFVPPCTPVGVMDKDTACGDFYAIVIEEITVGGGFLQLAAGGIVGPLDGAAFGGQQGCSFFGEAG